MTPVTRRELREELRALEERLEERLEAKLEAKLESKLESKLEAKLESKLESKLDAKFAAFETRLIDTVGKTLALAIKEMDANTARHVRASEERLRSEIRGLDDQYRDLPARVAALEDHTGIKR